MTEQNSEAAAQPGSPQLVRLVVSWLIVGVPLVYALYQTITSVLPLFQG